MFNNGKGRDDMPAAPVNAAPPAKRSARSSAPAIISADVVVTGSLVSTGDIQIDGRIDGDVRSAGLVIGDKAFIQGDIIAEDVTIRGRVQGGIRARKVLLCSTCHVEGNVLHESFAVESGAFFEGNCRHSENPLADDATTAPKFQSRSATASISSPAALTAAVSDVPRHTDARSATGATFAPMKSSG